MPPLRLEKLKMRPARRKSESTLAVRMLVARTAWLADRGRKQCCPAGRFSVYAAFFARRCCLLLAETGTVPTLFAENWYDGGTVEWNGAAQIGDPGKK